MGPALFLLITSPALAAEAPDLNRWARGDVGGFLNGLPAAASALGSERPTGPLDLPLAPPLPLPMGGSSPLTSWMERSAAATTRRIFAGVSELGRADVPVEPVPIEGDVVGLGLPPHEEPERWRPAVAREERAFEGGRPPQGGLSEPRPPSTELSLMRQRRPPRRVNKPTFRGTGFRTDMIKPSPIGPSGVSATPIPSFGER